MRDDFSQSTKELLARRVSLRCSNPLCRNPTGGPHDDPRRVVNIGVAAHIAAASPGGPRYDAGMTPDERADIANAIWLCQNCAKMIDNDPAAYPTEIVRLWRSLAEATAKNELERGVSTEPDDRFLRVEQAMPGLIREMREDLKNHPLSRRFFCTSKQWAVSTDALRYFYEDHSQLDDMVRILENLDLVIDVTRGTDIRYYQITEPFADYLRASHSRPSE